MKIIEKINPNTLKTSKSSTCYLPREEYVQAHL